MGHHFEAREHYVSEFYSKFSNKNLRLLIEKHNETHADQLVIPNEDEHYRDYIIDQLRSHYDLDEHRDHTFHLYRGDYVAGVESDPSSGEKDSAASFETDDKTAIIEWANRAQHIVGEDRLTQHPNGWQYTKDASSPDKFHSYIYFWDRESMPFNVAELIGVHVLHQNHRAHKSGDVFINIYTTSSDASKKDAGGWYNTRYDLALDLGEKALDGMSPYFLDLEQLQDEDYVLGIAISTNSAASQIDFQIQEAVYDYKDRFVGGTHKRLVYEPSSPAPPPPPDKVREQIDHVEAAKAWHAFTRTAYSY